MNNDNQETWTHGWCKHIKSTWCQTQHRQRHRSIQYICTPALSGHALQRILQIREWDIAICELLLSLMATHSRIRAASPSHRVWIRASVFVWFVMVFFWMDNTSTAPTTRTDGPSRQTPWQKNMRPHERSLPRPRKWGTSEKDTTLAWGQSKRQKQTNEKLNKHESRIHHMRGGGGCWQILCQVPQRQWAILPRPLLEIYLCLLLLRDFQTQVALEILV